MIQVSKDRKPCKNEYRLSNRGKNDKYVLFKFTSNIRSQISINFSVFRWVFDLHHGITTFFNIFTRSVCRLLLLFVFLFFLFFNWFFFWLFLILIKKFLQIALSKGIEQFNSSLKHNIQTYDDLPFQNYVCIFFIIIFNIFYIIFHDFAEQFFHQKHHFFSISNLLLLQCQINPFKQDFLHNFKTFLFAEFFICYAIVVAWDQDWWKILSKRLS